MWKKLLVTASFVVLGSFTALAQGKSCPTDTKDVREKVTVDVGVAGYERETHECKAEPQGKDTSAKDKPEPKDKPEHRDRRDRPNN